jgi:hypothetical protein
VFAGFFFGAAGGNPRMSQSEENTYFVQLIPVFNNIILITNNTRLSSLWR